jgi:hypothetical protein
MTNAHHMAPVNLANLSCDRYFLPLFNPQPSLRFLCRPAAFFSTAGAVGRHRALYTENSRFAHATLPWHISTFRGYQILFSIRNPYINRFTNHFSIHS